MFSEAHRVVKNLFTGMQGVLKLGAREPNVKTFLVDGVVRMKFDDDGIAG